MTRYFGTILMVLLTFGTHKAVKSQSTLIPFGASWHYSDVGHKPDTQNLLAWYEIGYHDTAWSEGSAQLGYGDDDEATVIGDSVITAYFRQRFTVADAAIFSDLDLNLIYDDGAVVYLNGSEIWRVNMPAGPIDYGTFSSSGSSDNATATTYVGNQLVDGENVLAVEVHQRSAGSSDISFDFRLRANPLGLVRVIRGPYLQKMSSNSVIVKWRTSVPSKSVVNFGTAIDPLNQSISDESMKSDHELEIQNLQANTKYSYEIADGDHVLVPAHLDMYIMTAPSQGSRDPVTAWILGDCGTGNHNARAVRDAYYQHMGSHHTDLMLFLGDNAYNDGTDEEYQTALFENMYEEQLRRTPSWSCLGNHDGHSANSSDQSGPYFEIFCHPTQGENGGIMSGTEAYYSFDYANIHFIALDSYESDREIDGDMFLWCQADLQNTMSDWIIAFWHHPPYSKGSHDSDAETALIDMRVNFLPLLESFGVDLVLSGHSHSYERSYFINQHYGSSDSFNPMVHTVGATGDGNGQTSGDGAYTKDYQQSAGAVYITGGSSGRVKDTTLDHKAMHYSVAELGSCILEVHGGELTVNFLRENGSIEDHFTIYKDLNCLENTPCDDGDFCTTGDSINEHCQCVGTRISDPPAHILIDAPAAPLDDTFKASASITVMNGVSTLANSTTTLIAPEVTLDPEIDVPLFSTFQILQTGCD